MKLHLLTIAWITAPVFVRSQSPGNTGTARGFPITPVNITVQKLVKDRTCDSCAIDRIYETSLYATNYVIINAKEEPSTQKAPGNNNAGRFMPFLSDHHIINETFTIDFLYPAINYQYSDSFLYSPAMQEDMHKSNPLQFSVYLNTRMIQDWKEIRTLEQDTIYKTGYFLQTPLRNPRFINLNNYHVGDFTLNVNDSLVILVRFSNMEEVYQSIFIKRVPVSLSSFDFIQFSSDDDLQEILNRPAVQDHSKNRAEEQLTMKSSEIALLRFNDSSSIKKEIEYSFDEGSGIWKKIIPDPHSNYSYILINKPAAGQTISLSLRYSLQRESIHRISIQVQQNFLTSIWFKLMVTVLSALILFAGWYMLKKQQHARQIRKLTLSKEETESKLQLLSGQLNPHFLFNSLNSVQNLINKKDTENANLYISEVSSFLRTIMDTGKKEYISLQEELKTEQTYMQLEQKRKDFTYELINNCGDNLSQVEFPPLLLQPIIENSIHHGFTRNTTDPHLKISIDCNNKQLNVSIHDNGQGFNIHAIRKGHGLTIVQKRILLMNEKLKDIAISMNIESSKEGTLTTFQFQNWL
ncbi:MAG: histidine kinase [Chitinophagaceae bacterium]|nr:histidine kinase [Chitinophagaceae bacterium]